MTAGAAAPSASTSGSSGWRSSCRWPGWGCSSAARARPQWEHHPSHFWLVLGTAAVSVALAYLTNEAANRRATPGSSSSRSPSSQRRLPRPARAGDARRAAAGAERRVRGRDAGRALARGVLRGGVDQPHRRPARRRLLRKRDAIRHAAIASMVAGASSRSPVCRRSRRAARRGGGRAITALAIVAVPLFGWRPWRYFGICIAGAARSRSLSFAALVLLAEAMIAVALSRNWHLSWWEWHLLMRRRSR